MRCCFSQTCPVAQQRMRFTVLALFGALVLVIMPLAAQAVQTISAGETVRGEIAPGNTAPSYFFEANDGDTFTVRLTTETDGFNPVILLADSNNRVLQTFSAPLGSDFVGGVFTLDNGGRYFMQIQGAGGSQGTFTLSLLTGDQTLVDSQVEMQPTAEPSPTTDMAGAETSSPVETPEQPQASLSELVVGQREDAAVSASVPVQSYAVRVGSIPLLLEARRVSDGALRFTLSDSATGEMIGMIAPSLNGGLFVLDSGTYTLSAELADQSFAVSYRLWLVPLGSGDSIAEALQTLALSGAAADTQPVSDGAQPNATPIPAGDVDILLRWDYDDLTLTNISSAPVDISTISFAGDNRRADTSYWLNSNPSLRLTELPPNACVGFRPYAAPDPPPLPPNCTNLGAWWSADIVYFWGGDRFDVLLNGVPIATCETVTGTCGIALP